jgi:hypothetical protein
LCESVCWALGIPAVLWLKILANTVVDQKCLSGRLTEISVNLDTNTCIIGLPDYMYSYVRPKRMFVADGTWYNRIQKVIKPKFLYTVYVLGLIG